MTILSMLATFAGGGAGAVCRYATGRVVGRSYNGDFPLGTFLINVSGCFALGLVASLVIQAHRDLTFVTALLATGFLGGYTTFSTYALEGILLIGERKTRLAAVNQLGSVLCGIVAAALGAGLAHMLS